jgi:restriction system protein
MIWSYSPINDDRNRASFASKCCQFCKTDLSTLESPRLREGGEGEQGWVHEEWARVNACTCCGWWKIEKTVNDYTTKFGAVSSLKTLDLSDLSSPLEDVRRFLVANYRARFGIHPRLWEETVGSVFKGLGYSVEVTGYSNDGGIDVILSKNASQIGVQVKRYRDSIQVDQIRELAGALVLKGITKGIFVTTSTFQKGAVAAAAAYETRGYAIELLDSDRFYQTLKLSQRPMYRSFEEFVAEYPLNKLTLMDHTVAA